MVFNVGRTPDLNLSLIYHLDTCSINSTCECKALDSVNSIKYLGLSIDSNLKWKSHILYIVKKLRFLLFRFKHLRYSTSNKFLLQLYYAWVHPVLSYGIVAWGSDYISNFSVINSLHSKILKIILNNNNHVNLLIYHSINILPLRYLYFYKTSIFIFKNPDFCERKIFTSLRRTNEIYKIPFPNKEIMRKSFTYLGPKFFNSLPLNIQSSNSVHLFRKQLKCFLFACSNIEYFF